MTVVDLHVRETGEGAPVVLLHAFPLSSAMWLEQRNDLADTCRVITPDLRGFGGSQLGFDEPSLDLMADDVAAVLDRLDLPEVVLGGLSMGGYVAMAFLRRHPGRVSALVLADTKAGADPDAAKDNRRRIADMLVEDDSTQVLVDEVLPALVGETTRRDQPLVQGRVRALLEAAPPAAAAWAQRAMAARPDSLDTLRKVDVPAVVILGEEDQLASRDDAEAMVEALPQGQLVLIRGAGHLSAVEAPDAFSTAVREMLGRL
jgi:pimeloyl-ACP methyl ester carboxylesterase